MASAGERTDNDIEFLSHDGEMAGLVRAFDWASTPIGAPSQWSPSLRMVVRFMFANRFPLLLWWGPHYIQIYNDHYAPVLGSKHPAQALGRPVRECWSEIYDVLGPLVDTPFHGGPATWMEDIELILQRHGFPEESHFTVAYSPVPDDTAPRGIGGVLATVHEITEKVIGERRVKILSQLGVRLAEVKSDEEVGLSTIGLIGQHPKDLPFALLYLVDDGRKLLRLVSATGIDAIGPSEIALDALDGVLPWPVNDALRGETLQLREGLAQTLDGRAPRGPWGHPTDAVAVVPLKSSTAHRPAGVLVAGISACIRPDALYLAFLELVGARVASAVANARAYEEERRRAEALAEIDRAKTTFFSNVSHEFRTPLALMLGPLEDVLGTAELPVSVRAPLERVQRNAQRLHKLVNSLLDFARIEADRMDASFAPVDLAALTADIASTFRSAMVRGGLVYRVECAPLGEPVYVDREMWEKLLLNLLSNAFKFTLEGEVRVSLARDGDHAVLEVADTGVGVPADEVPRLFERFHRVEGTRSRTHEGSGIGLALVHELVRMHGGSIDARSTLGRGTTLRVRLPFGSAHLPPQRTQGAALVSTATSPAAYVEEALRWLPDASAALGAMPPNALRDERFAATFGSRVLLADDNADMRAYVRELLGASYEVIAVPDGQQAVEEARRALPDLLVADVMMPGLDGFGVLRALRADALLRDVPVLLLSARAGEEARVEGLAAGADDYLVKPFNARELLARVGSLLELTRVRRESEQRFRAFVQATSDVVYRMSPDWTEMRQLHGHNVLADQPDPSRDWLLKYIPDDHRDEVMAHIERAIRTKSVFEFEHRVIRADGTVGWIFSRAIPMLNTHGEVIEWFGAASDVTERRRTQEALERQRRDLQEADRQKNEFLAMLAHELRNPLAPIRSAGELLSRTIMAEPHTRAALATVERQVAHLTRLVDDLLDISRITQGRIELRRAPVLLDRIVAQALEAVDPLLRQKQHRMVLISSRRALTVNADPERLVQCISNVLSNAAKYTPPRGEIRVESRDEEGDALVIISDNGAGISQELLPRVFDLFVQGERTLDRAQGGLGVGLTIVKRLVEMHGGTISARSEGVAQGASFEIRLPLLREASGQASSAPVDHATPQRILLVDDNEDGAQTLAGLLELDGHEVQVAFSGSQALERLKTFHPDVALLDIGLPGLNGYELARRIHAEPEHHDLRLIAITGYGQEADRERTQGAGFAAHLVKPVEYAALERVLSQV